MKQFIIYSEKTSARSKYVFDFVFRQFLNVPYVLLDEKSEYEQSDGYKINYSTAKVLPSELYVYSTDLLLEENIYSQSIKIDHLLDFPIFFKHDNHHSDLFFDPFAMIFYLISRYEEYLDFEPDMHGRFPARQSLAYKVNFLHLPIVDQCILWLKTQLLKKYPSSEFPLKNYSFLPTYDIDIAWFMKNRSKVFKMGSLIKKVLRGELKTLANMLTKKEDPYDVYEYIGNLHKVYQLSPIYFFLLGNLSKYDRGLSYKNKHLQELIKTLQTKYVVGIHPSYQSNTNNLLLKKEINSLKTIINKDIVESRQHYLKLHLPTTYRRLIAEGIKRDYSMGYAAAIGFRASTATPFLWYDLDKEEITDLEIIPFQVMDVTLKYYMKLTPKEAVNTVQSMVKATKEVGGTFCTLWHNSSFSYVDDWEEWKPVYEEILIYGNT